MNVRETTVVSPPSSFSCNSATLSRNFREMILERRTLLLLSHLALVSCVNDNIMIRDYFMHKGVSNIVGFSCGSLESAREKNTCIFIYNYIYLFLHYYTSNMVSFTNRRCKICEDAQRRLRIDGNTESQFCDRVTGAHREDAFADQLSQFGRLRGHAVRQTQLHRDLFRGKKMRSRLKKSFKYSVENLELKKYFIINVKEITCKKVVKKIKKYERGEKSNYLH